MSAEFDFDDIVEIERPVRGKASAIRSRAAAASRGKGNKTCRDYIDPTVCEYDDLCHWNEKIGCVLRPLRSASPSRKAKTGAKKGPMPAGLAKYHAELKQLKEGGMTHKDAQAALRARKQKGGWFY